MFQKISCFAVFIMCLFNARISFGQEILSTTWEDLFNIYFAPANARENKVLGAQFDFRDILNRNAGNRVVTGKQYKKVMVNHQGEWDEKIMLYDRSEQVMFCTQNPTFYSQMRGELMSKYGFNEPVFAQAGFEIFSKDNSVVECMSTRATNASELSWHCINIRHIDKRFDPVISADTPKITEAKFVALVIGVNDYPADIGTLREASPDAKRVYDLLMDQYGFDKELSLLLTGRVTKANVAEALQSFASLRRDQNLLIYYAGHGGFLERASIDQSEGYWILSDINSNNPADGRMFNTEIKNLIRLIPSGHTLLISDACYGGGFVQIERMVNIQSVQKTEVDHYHDRSRQVITSTGTNATPDNSMFCDFFIDVLKENNRRFLSATDVFITISDRMAKNHSATMPVYGRIPEAGDASGSFIFIR